MEENGRHCAADSGHPEMERDIGILFYSPLWRRGFSLRSFYMELLETVWQ